MGAGISTGAIDVEIFEIVAHFDPIGRCGAGRTAWGTMVEIGEKDEAVRGMGRFEVWELKRLCHGE